MARAVQAAGDAARCTPPTGAALPPASLAHVLGVWEDQHGTKYHVKLDGISATSCTVHCTKSSGKSNTLRAMIRFISAMGDKPARVVWGLNMGEEYDLDMSRVSKKYIRWNHAHGKPNRIFEWKHVEEPGAPPPPPPNVGNGLPKGLKSRRNYTPLDLGAGAVQAVPAAGTAKLAPWCRNAPPDGVRVAADRAGSEPGPETPTQKPPAGSGQPTTLAEATPGTSLGTTLKDVTNELQMYQVPTRVQAGQISNMEASQEFICRICLDLCDNPMVLPCSHLFCQGCLRALIDWKASDTSLECPACRAEVSQEQLSQDAKNSDVALAFLRRCIGETPVCCVFAPQSALPDLTDDPLPGEHIARKMGLACSWIGKAGAHAPHIEASCPVAVCVRQLARVHGSLTGDDPNLDPGGSLQGCVCLTHHDVEVAADAGPVPIPSGTPCLVRGGRGDTARGTVEVLATVLWLDTSTLPSEHWVPASAFVPMDGQAMRTRRPCSALHGNSGYLALAAGEEVFAFHFEWDQGTRAAWFYGHSAAQPDAWGWFAADLVDVHLRPERGKA